MFLGAYAVGRRSDCWSDSIHGSDVPATAISGLFGKEMLDRATLPVETVPEEPAPQLRDPTSTTTNGTTIATHPRPPIPQPQCEASTISVEHTSVALGAAESLHDPPI